MEQKVSRIVWKKNSADFYFVPSFFSIQKGLQYTFLK